jgi:hypothetical protein
MARDRAAVREFLAPSREPGRWARADPLARTRRPAGTDLGEPGQVRHSQGHRIRERCNQEGRIQEHRNQEQRSCHGHGKRRPGHRPRARRNLPGHTDPAGRKDHPPTRRGPPDRNPPATRTGPRCRTCRPGHMPGGRVRISLALEAGRPEHGYWRAPARHARDDPWPGLAASPAARLGPADPGGPVHPEEPVARPPLTDRPLPSRPSELRHPASRSIRASRPMCAANPRQTNPPGSAHRAGAADWADPPRSASPRWRPRQTSRSHSAARPTAPVQRMNLPGPASAGAAEQARSRSWPTGLPRRTCRTSRPRRAH